MNLAAAAVEMPAGLPIGGSTVECVIFVVSFAVVGLILFFAAARLVRGNPQPHVPRYAHPRH